MSPSPLEEGPAVAAFAFAAAFTVAAAAAAIVAAAIVAAAVVAAGIGVALVVVSVLPCSRFELFASIWIYMYLLLSYHLCSYTEEISLCPRRRSYGAARLDECHAMATGEAGHLGSISQCLLSNRLVARIPLQMDGIQTTGNNRTDVAQLATYLASYLPS